MKNKAYPSDQKLLGGVRTLSVFADARKPIRLRDSTSESEKAQVVAQTLFVYMRPLHKIEVGEA